MDALQVENWTALMVRATTPDAIVDKLGAEVVQIMASPDIADRAKTQGFRVDARGPQAFSSFLSSEIDRWAKVIVAANITAE